MSPWHWGLVVAAAVLVFGGGGKISGLMGDAAKGLRAFKDGLSGADADEPPTA